MKPLYYLLFSFFYATLGVSSAWATHGKYRLTLRDNPATTITVGWDQMSGASAVIYYGTQDFGTDWEAYPLRQSADRQAPYRGMNNHFARLANLTPNTIYYFVVRDEESVSRRFWFRTAPDRDTERLSLIAGGDSRNNRVPRQNANKLVAKLRPHAVLFGGDMTDDDTDQEWNDWFEDWQLTTGEDGRMIPIVAARGNHEDSNRSVYDLFDTPSANVYYGLTFGGNLIRTYTLNSLIPVGGQQAEWLQNDLSQSASVHWKMAQYHFPMAPHTKSKVSNIFEYTEWAPLFEEHQVKLVVECDAHMAKTTWPIVPDTRSGSEEGFRRDDERGTVYVGEGCWGAPLRNNDDDKRWTRASGSFNQFKWIFVDRSKVEVRTIRTDNADEVNSVNDADIFQAPADLDVWSPATGAVVTMYHDSFSAPQATIVSPSSLASLAVNQAVNITVNASDEDGTITDLEFYANNTYLGRSTQLSFAWQPPAAGVYDLTVRATDDDGLETVSSPVRVLVGGAQVNVSAQIQSGDDDAEEDQFGSVYVNSSDLELVNDGFVRGNQWVGLRFQQLNIPPGATITDAYLQFTTDETNGRSTELTIQGEASGNSESFRWYDNGNITRRARTQASVVWRPADWKQVGEASEAQRSPGLQPVLQEIVNQPDWQTSSALTLLIHGQGRRRAEAYEGERDRAAILYVSYTGAKASRTASVAAKPTSIVRKPAIAVRHEAVITSYPNPFAEVIHVSIDDLETQYSDATVTLSLLNDAGQYVVSEADYALEQGVATLITSTLPAGGYTLLIQHQGQTHSKRMIKHE